MRVAVLGGGMGGVTAAWHLARAGHDVTIYQRGWRLGGKGASGRNGAQHQRIEEHGLHVLMGFYEQTFRLLKDVYTEAHAAPPGPDGAPLPFAAAFTGWDTCVFSRQRSNGQWSFFPVTFPSKPDAPWDPPGARDFRDLFRAGVALLEQVFAELRLAIPLKSADTPMRSVLKALLDAADTVAGVAGAALLPILEALLKPIVKRLANRAKTEREEWLFIGFCFVLGNALAMLRDGLVVPRPDFDSIDHEDYRAWIGSALAKVGAPDWAAEKSPLVLALYDLAFSRERTLAAGVTLRTVMRLGLDYRGQVAFKMNAGMGDVVFSPFAIALERLGVKFEYFHRVTALRLDASKTGIDAIELEHQVATPNGYPPLVSVGGVACWPHEPKSGLLAPKYQADFAANGNVMPYDFERAAPPSPYAVPRAPLQHGQDFDVVVLAIPVGELGTICGDLMARHQPFRTMVDGLDTIRTVALQTWLSCTFAALKSPAPKGMVISYASPFNSWADMEQVLVHEQWPPNTVKNLAYFCDAIPDVVTDAAAPQWAATEADKWLQHGVGPLWPGYSHPQDLVAKLTRVNTMGSERYVLTEAGGTAKRLGAAESGFVNLALAGDWVKTALNSGCLEAATLGGSAAADAILSQQVSPGGNLGMPQYVERDGDWVLRPPGRLEQVDMHLFVLRAGGTELQALCDRFINGPSGGAVTATPVFPNFPLVLLTCADIARGFSQDPDDAGRGWMAERDVGFFVPVTLRSQGRAQVANLLPYLYVDNFAAVLIGREIFGFPKILADIRFRSAPWSCTVTSTVSFSSNPAQPAGPGSILTATRISPLPGFPLPGKLDEAILAILKAVRLVLGMPPDTDPDFATIPMVFLKQFRDAVVRTGACHQSIVLAEAGIDAFRGGAIWVGPQFSVTIPPYHSVDIATHLGLVGGPTFHPLLTVRAAIDFGLPFGTALWTAP